MADNTPVGTSGTRRVRPRGGAIRLTPQLRAQGEANVGAAMNAIAGATTLIHATQAQRGPSLAPAAAPAAVGWVPAETISHKLAERVFYPAHKQRTESKEYRAAHKHLVVEEDLPCLVCGVRNSTLTDPKQNRFGSSKLETHHHIIEWAFINAVDLNKFNDRIVASLKVRFPHEPQYQVPFTQQQMEDWVDHGLGNLWVLCDVHHRHIYVGIHAITYPIWGPQDVLVDGFGPREAEALAPKPAAAGGH